MSAPDSDESDVTGDDDDDDCPLTESMRPLGEAAAAWTRSHQAVASQARHHTPHLNTPQHYHLLNTVTSSTLTPPQPHKNQPGNSLDPVGLCIKHNLPPLFNRLPYSKCFRMKTVEEK